MLHCDYLRISCYLHFCKKNALLSLFVVNQKRLTMGTYTTNKNLFMPTIGEQGWGELVNGNFETIDNFLKPISLSGSTYIFTGNHVGNQSGGSISATSISNSGTLTNTGTSTFTGKITANGSIGTTSLTTSSTITSTGQIVANGGVKGNLTGNVTGNTTGLLFVKGTIGTSGDVEYAKCPAISATSVSVSTGLTFTVPGYSITFGNPVKHTWGVYTRRSDLSGNIPTITTRPLTFICTSNSGGVECTYVNASGETVSEWCTDTESKTVNVKVGTSVTLQNKYAYCTYSVPALTTYKVKYARP